MVSSEFCGPAIVIGFAADVADAVHAFVVVLVAVIIIVVSVGIGDGRGYSS